MNHSTNAPERVRFGAFELNVRTGELVSIGTAAVEDGSARVQLRQQPFQVLRILVERQGNIVTRQEIKQILWPDDTVVEFDRSINVAVTILRKALADDADHPKYIETLVGRGYRLIAPAEWQQSSTAAQDLLEPRADTLPAPKHSRRATIIGACAVVLVVVSYMSWRNFWGARPPASRKLMLAVLPFANLTGDPNKEYLADGLTEEMISQLGRLNPEQLGVIARTSVMGYKHKDVRLDQIGHDLSVQYVLENSLRESGDHLRLTAQLIQVKDQTHLWTEDYDYPAKNILTVEDEVANAVAREIRVRLTSQQQEDLARSPPVNPEAFDAYLQGYYYWQRGTDKDTDIAAKYFERATQIDPSYALAWAWLSRARNWQADEGLIPMEEGRRLSREAIERALALNPNLAAAHAQMGRIKQQVDYDWAGADASFQRAVALEPANAENVGFAAWPAAIFGRFDEALKLNRRAVDLDPLDANSWERLGATEVFMGQLDQAAADCKKALELNPEASGLLSQIYLMQGRPQDALREVERVHYAPLRAFLYALTYHALGREKESDAALRELKMKYHASNAFEIAAIYAFRNQTDEAFEWLDRAYAQRDPSMMSTKVQPLLNSLHNDPRFAALLKKLNLPN
jgi:TolB-like protein/DNA-binding winged helix-turn-helix (wHTH) protein/Tfp pilus assembly protein PilF